jgi:hypothetical protein
MTMKVLGLLLAVLLVLAIPLAYALPSPIKFQRSIPYTVFNTTSATVYDVESPITAPFEINIVNSLTYSSTGTKGAIIKIQDAKTGSMNAFEIIVYNTKAIDINYTDKATGTTTRVATVAGSDNDKIPREILIENSGTSINVYDLTNNKHIMKDFVLPNTFNIVAISAYGNSSTESVATDGYVTVYAGGLNPSKSVAVSFNSFLPLIGAVVGISVVLAVINKLKSKV